MKECVIEAWRFWHSRCPLLSTPSPCPRQRFFVQSRINQSLTATLQSFRLINVRFSYRSSTGEQRFLCSDRERIQRAFHETSQTIDRYITSITQRKFEHLNDTSLCAVFERNERMKRSRACELSTNDDLRRGCEAITEQGLIQEVDEYQCV